MFPVLFRDRMSPSDVRHLDGPAAVLSLSEFPLQRLLRLPPVCPVHHPHRFRPLRLQLSMARPFSLSPNRCGQSFFSRFSISLPPFPGRTFPFGYVNPGRDSGWNKGGLLLRSEEQNIVSVFFGLSDKFQFRYDRIRDVRVAGGEVALFRIGYIDRRRLLQLSIPEKSTELWKFRKLVIVPTNPSDQDFYKSRNWNKNWRCFIVKNGTRVQ